MERAVPKPKIARPELRLALVLGMAAGIAILTAVAVNARSVGSGPTAGRMPSQSGLPSDEKAIPDLVAVENDQQQVVGYAWKSDLEPGAGKRSPDEPTPTTPAISVWDSSGQILQGHMFPDGVGFVTLAEEQARGLDPANPPTPSRGAPTTLGDP